MRETNHYRYKNDIVDTRQPITFQSKILIGLYGNIVHYDSNFVLRLMLHLKFTDGFYRNDHSYNFKHRSSVFYILLVSLIQLNICINYVHKSRFIFSNFITVQNLKL